MKFFVTYNIDSGIIVRSGYLSASDNVEDQSNNDSSLHSVEVSRPLFEDEKTINDIRNIIVQV